MEWNYLLSVFSCCPIIRLGADCWPILFLVVNKKRRTVDTFHNHEDGLIADETTPTAPPRNLSYRTSRHTQESTSHVEVTRKGRLTCIMSYCLIIWCLKRFYQSFNILIIALNFCLFTIDNDLVYINFKIHLRSWICLGEYQTLVVIYQSPAPMVLKLVIYQSLSSLMKMKR